MDKKPMNKAVTGSQPQGQAIPSVPTQTPTGAQRQPTELEVRAQNEIAMLEQTAKKKQMLSQMKPKIGAEEIKKASDILRKYKKGKDRLEQKIIANEDFWKLRQWNYKNEGKADFKPATAWLWSCIQSR